MSAVAEIEAAIEKLAPEEYGELLVWIEEHQTMVGASEALFALYDEEEWPMPKAQRGELWMADLGMVAKVRPVLILRVAYQEHELTVGTYALRTTSVRGPQYEVLYEARGMPRGALDAQGIASIPDVKLERRLGFVEVGTLAKVENAVRSWLSSNWFVHGSEQDTEKKARPQTNLSHVVH